MAGMDKLPPDNRNAYQHAGNDRRKAENEVCLEDAGWYQKMQKRKRKSEKRIAKKEQERKRKEGKQKPDAEIMRSCRKIFCVIMPEISAVHLWSLPQVLPCFCRCHYCWKFPYAHAYIWPKKSEKGSAYAQEAKPELAATNYRKLVKANSENAWHG